MFWHVLALLLIITTIIFLIGLIISSCKLSKHKENLKLYDRVINFTDLFFVSFVFTLLMVGIVCGTINEENLKIREFKKQKYIIEQTTKDFPQSDNYIMMLKKTELNEWLYKAQYRRKNHGIFSLEPKEVLELEEIQ